MSAPADVVILAGGFGTRMSGLFPDVPKPLVPVAGVPILEIQLLQCKKYRLLNVLILVHFNAHRIIDCIGNGEKFGLNITYCHEKVPLGTGGALFEVVDKVASTFLVLYADVYSYIDLSVLKDWHEVYGADVTVVAHPNSHPHDSDLLVLDENHSITAISGHPHECKNSLRNMVNAALYVFDKDCLLGMERPIGKHDIAQELFPTLLESGFSLKAYVTVEYLKDMGTPERLKNVEKDIAGGIPKARSLSQPRRAVFFDRDGTINEDVGHLSDADKLKLINGAASAIKKVNDSGYLAICTTNQPVVARGELTLTGLHEIHSKLDFELGALGAFLDHISYCPHHPDTGFKGEVIEYKVRCDCRKPASGMFESAASAYGIDLNQSWVIGDRTADLRSAFAIGARGILVQTGSAGRDGLYPTRPHFVAQDIHEAVSFVLEQAPVQDQFFQHIFPRLKNCELVFVSGKSRSGKTTFASNLQWYLTSVGRSAHVMELDRYLLQKRLETNHFLNRYDLDSAKGVAADLLLGTSTRYADIGFDHNQEGKIKYGEGSVGVNPILIVEGTASGYCSNSWGLGGLHIAILSDESDRFIRFSRKYDSRGIKSDAIRDLWDKRKLSEDRFILDAIKSSDFTFSYPSISDPRL